ncbi:HEAT repeat domain-containing protein [Pyrococcus yayanosii]|uniref:Uncharacterized protein n=1 Tax=Pyrococcus yayanosii (strain CH1 / JCM 16557) TaxID=529709 RepID=F8AI57_PYRYC|nr:HEAT repeat domain-containing protein [Pyrococcus yayanosii]AEH24284.1 hypothetical protein PYCH_05960 [Pyrococcus yayanosii CH1]
MLAAEGEFFLVNFNQLRNDIKNWRLREAVETLERISNPEKLLKKLLHDKDTAVKGNTIYLIEKLVKENKIKQETVEALLDDLMALTEDDNEKLTLDTVRLFNVILEKFELEEKDYDRIMEVLMNVVSSGRGIASEYAAEGLGILGAALTRVAKKIIKLLVSLIKGSKDREVQSAAMTALTEIASRTKDKEVLNEAVSEIASLLDSEDVYLKERAISSLERIVTVQRSRISSGILNTLKEKVRSIAGGNTPGSKVNALMKVISKEEAEDTLPDEFGIEDIENLFDKDKHEIVAEMAKKSDVILDRIIELLSSEDYIRRTDALWVISRVIGFLGPTRAYSILPILGDFLRSNNPWIRTTAAKTLAEIYSLYPGTKEYIISLLDLMLKSSDRKTIEAALELIKEITSRSSTKELFRAAMILTIKRLNDPNIRLPILKFYALSAEELLSLDREILEALLHKLSEVYGKAGNEEKELIIYILDLINTLLEEDDKGEVRRDS